MFSDDEKAARRKSAAEDVQYGPQSDDEKAVGRRVKQKVAQPAGLPVKTSQAVRREVRMRRRDSTVSILIHFTMSATPSQTTPQITLYTSLKRQVRSFQTTNYHTPPGTQISSKSVLCTRAQWRSKASSRIFDRGSTLHDR